MSKHVKPPETPKDIERIELKDALEERYLAYALSTIMHRALPDVRDGLKPVHRRLLHVMRLLRLDPGAAPASGMSRLPLGAIGAVVGSTIGLLAALIGVLVPRGRARRFVIPAMTIAVGAGVLLVVASVIAALGGQPPDVVITLLLSGISLAVVFGAALPMVRRGYAIAELRRMRALDHA